MWSKRYAYWGAILIVVAAGIVFAIYIGKERGWWFRGPNPVLTRISKVDRLVLTRFWSGLHVEVECTVDDQEWIKRFIGCFESIGAPGYYSPWSPSIRFTCYSGTQETGVIVYEGNAIRLSGDIIPPDGNDLPRYKLTERSSIWLDAILDEVLAVPMPWEYPARPGRGGKSHHVTVVKQLPGPSRAAEAPVSSSDAMDGMTAIQLAYAYLQEIGHKDVCRFDDAIDREKEWEVLFKIPHPGQKSDMISIRVSKTTRSCTQDSR